MKEIYINFLTLGSGRQKVCFGSYNTAHGHLMMQVPMSTIFEWIGRDYRNLRSVRTKTRHKRNKNLDTPSSPCSSFKSWLNDDDDVPMNSSGQ